jgi:phosphoglycolate phosphatase
MSYDIVSFDLDGTLVDTAGEIAEAANRALESHGIARRPVPEITRLIGHGTHELIAGLVTVATTEQPDLAARVQLPAVQASMDLHYAATTGTMARTFDGARAGLELLRATGVRLACVTNKELRHARRVLEVTGLQEFFALTIGGDSLPTRKPDAGVLRHVVGALGCEPWRSAHVGDSRIDVEAARNAGVAAWAVPYGYNAGRPIAESRPDAVFPDLLAVAEAAIAIVPDVRCAAT